MQTCRLCLYEGTDVLSIFTNEHENLVKEIWECVAITVKEEDPLPTTICATCLQNVKQWIIFKETCIKTQSILEKTYQETVLSETELNKDGNNDSFKVLQNESFLTELSDINPNDDFDSTEDNLQLEKYLKKSNNSVPEADDKNSDLEFEDLDELECFSDNEYNIPQNVYQCSICFKEFTGLFQYLDHQESHNGEMVFKCDRCEMMFDNRKDLVEHDSRHPVSCPVCYKMILPRSMRLHLVLHTDKYKCALCSSRFNSRATYTQHYTTMHTDIKDHVCETCGKRFSTLTSMRVHLKSHSDERPYTCKLCNYAGRTSSAIYVHMSTHENGLRVCEMCSKTFKSNRNLHDHLRRVHCKVKKHVCGFCDKKFVDKYMLRVHVRCHTGVRPYQCSVCDKAFIRSDGLKEHMATHGQRTMYDCRSCGKKFTSRRGVSRHTCTAVN